MIRAYMPNDLQKVLAIFRQNTPKYFALAEEKDLKEYLQEHGNTYFVYVQNGQLLGSGGYNYKDTIGKTSWYFIDTKHQKQGIGEQLIQHALKKLQAQKEVKTLFVSTSQYAYLFFKKFGFKTIKTEKDYWADGIDLYEMTMKNKSKKITIKKARLADLEGLAQLFDAYRVFYDKPSDRAAATAFLKERISKEESEIFIACTKKGKMVGFTQIYPLFSSTRMQRLWLLNDLFIKPKYRGRGISVQLIEAAKELCRATDACSLCLETGKDNTIGNQLYPRTDFELDEEYNHYEWTTKK